MTKKRQVRYRNTKKRTSNEGNSNSTGNTNEKQPSSGLTGADILIKDEDLFHEGSRNTSYFNRQPSPRDVQQLAMAKNEHLCANSRNEEKIRHAAPDKSNQTGSMTSSACFEGSEIVR